MAIYHMHGQIIQRTAGRSAVGCAAYRAGVALNDERLKEFYDYTRKRGVEESFILGPVGMPSWLAEREALWNAVEGAERVNGQPAREFDVALPIELVQANPRAAKALARDWVHDMFVVEGLIVDVAFHDMQSHNPHFHAMVTTRLLHPHACEFQPGSPEVFGKKARHLNDRSCMDVWRKQWAAYANAAMARHGIDARIDPRSLANQGVTDREPGTHVGPNAKVMWEEKGIERDRWERNAIIWWNNEQPWFEENDRYVAFLEAEAAEERALEEQARAQLANRPVLEDLADRLQTAAATAIGRRVEQLDRTAARGDEALSLLAGARINQMQQLSSRLDNNKAMLKRGLGDAVRQLVHTDFRLKRSMIEVQLQAEAKLDGLAGMLTVAGKKSWYQAHHRSRGPISRLEAVGSRVTAAAQQEFDRLGVDRQRLSNLEQRLDTAASATLNAKGRQVLGLEQRLGAAQIKIGTAARRLSAVGARLSDTHGVLHELDARLAAQGQRLEKVSSRILRERRARLRHLVERFDEASPSQAAMVVGGSSRAIMGLWRGGTDLLASIASQGLARWRRSAGFLSQVIDRGGSAVAAFLRRARDYDEDIGRRHLPVEEPEASADNALREDEHAAAREAEAHRQFALQHLRNHAATAVLPVRRSGADIALDIEALPRGLPDLIRPIAGDPAIRELLDHDEGKREERIIILLASSRERLVFRNAQGGISVQPMLFPPQLQEHVVDMLRHNPTLQSYALAMVERHRSQPKVIPSPSVSSRASGSSQPPAQHRAHNDAENERLRQQAEALARRRDRGR